MRFNCIVTANILYTLVFFNGHGSLANFNKTDEKNGQL